MFASLLASSGLILLDPLDLRLHRLAGPILSKAIEQRDSLEQQLLDRGKALEKAGYDAQVKITRRNTTVFHISVDGRQVITSHEGKFESGARTWTQPELLAAIHDQPENFSPNALLRPVVQDFLLPTVALIGGPAEISYFAQSEVLYRNLLGRMPVMLPRAGFTLVDPKAQRLLAQYGLGVEDVWKGPQELRKQLRKASVPENISELLDVNGSEIKKRLLQWSEAVSALDPSLKSAVDTAQEKIAYQTEKLQQKIGQALDRKLNVLAAHEEFLSNTALSREGVAIPRIVLSAVRCPVGTAGFRRDRTALWNQEYRFALHHSLFRSVGIYSHIGARVTALCCARVS